MPLNRTVLQALMQGKSINELPLRVTYYARVSTDKDEQINSLGNQINYYEEYINKNPNWDFIPGYVDEGLSGTSVNRRESFLRMLRDAKAGLFDLILTKEISRFSRNTLDSIMYTRELLEHGVGVYFQSDNINTLMPDSELRLTIMSSIAQDEVRRLSERLKFGYKRAIADGRVLGQNNMWGYDKEKGRLTINEREAEIVHKVFHLYAEGKQGLRAIAATLQSDGILDRNGNMLSYGTLYHMIKNPKYKGWYAGHKTESKDYRKRQKTRLPESEWVTHPDKNIPAIVSEQLWDNANALLRKRGETMRTHGKACQSRYPYSGKIICAEHGTSFHRHLYRNGTGDKEVWTCKIYREKGKKACDVPTLYTSEINAVLSAAFDNMKLNRTSIISELTEVYKRELAGLREPKELTSIPAEMSSIDTKKDVLFELYATGNISGDEFKRRNDKLTEQLEQLLSRKKQLQYEWDLSKTAGEQCNIIRTSLEKALTPPYDDALLAAMLRQIVVAKRETGNIYLDIWMSPGKQLGAVFERKTKSISFTEIGISQAQVSRLEKNAISQMKKYL